MSRLLLALIVPLMALLAGCSQTSSEDIATSGMWADLSATATDDSSIEARAIYRSGGLLSNTYIEMSGSDYVDATHDTTTRLMNKESVLATIQYATTFSNLTQSGGELVTITLHRADETPTETDIHVPETFAIGTPDANTIYHIGTNDSITVSWAPSDSGDAMRVTYGYTCSADGLDSRYFSGSKIHEMQGDPGTDSAAVTEVLESLANDSGINLSALSCNVTITVERKRTQEVAAAYKGGSAVGIQKRQVHVLFVP